MYCSDTSLEFIVELWHHEFLLVDIAPSSLALFVVAGVEYHIPNGVQKNILTL